MMYGTQKSDSPIVALKPTNKDERSDAESVEPRGGAEGNTDRAGLHPIGHAERIEHMARLHLAG